jgi:hypothetical protein
MKKQTVMEKARERKTAKLSRDSYSSPWLRDQDFERTSFAQNWSGKSRERTWK